MHRHQERLGTYFAFVCAVFFLIIVFSGRTRDESSTNEYASKEYSEEEFLKLFVSTHGKSRFLDTHCFDQNTCLEIRDEVFELKRSNPYISGQQKIRRAVRKGFLVLTYAFLKLPEKLTRSALDTRHWEIDNSVKPTGIEGRAIDEMFASGAIPLTEKSNARVLALGLGGGSLPSYLHHTFPQMSITAVEIHRPTIEMAKKWYSLETDKLFQVVIGDGVEYLRQSVQEGRQFDVIVLDACFIEKHKEIHCPSTVFLEAEPIENMATLLGERGVLIVDVLPNSKPLRPIVEKVKALFLKYFKYCKEKHIEAQSNFVLTFTQFKHKELYAELSHLPDSSRDDG